MLTHFVILFKNHHQIGFVAFSQCWGWDRTQALEHARQVFYHHPQVLTLGRFRGENRYKFSKILSVVSLEVTGSFCL
jgi:hypothetical protein